MRQVLALTVVVSGAAFAFIFGNEADELTLLDLGLLLAMLAGILAVQAGLLLGIDALFARFGRPAAGRVAAKIGAAVLVASNAYFTAFIMLDASLQTQVALSAALGGATLAALLRPRWQGFALFVCAVYFILSLGLYAYVRIAMTREIAPRADLPRVEATRNVYLIGNESLASPRAYREVYGISDQPHVDYLRSRGFRVLDQAYSADVTTLRSYSRMLDFGRDVPEEDARRRTAFRSMNSTFAAFLQSGFRTQFIYRVTYFGLDPELVTYAYPEKSFAHCEFAPRRFFYILCAPFVHRPLNKLLFGMDFNLDIAIDRIRAAARSNAPWLTIYHHSVPFHSPLGYDYRTRGKAARFRNRVRRVTGRIVESGMDEIVSTILEEDPDSVIVLFGDHGAVSTGGADLDSPEPPMTTAEIFQDRYGVMLAVYPRDFCTQRIFEGSTTLHLVESVIHCLNGNDSPTAAERQASRIFYWEDEPRDVARYIGLRVSPERAAR